MQIEQHDLIESVYTNPERVNGALFAYNGGVHVARYVCDSDGDRLSSSRIQDMEQDDLFVACARYLSPCLDSTSTTPTRTSLVPLRAVCGWRPPPALYTMYRDTYGRDATIRRRRRAYTPFVSESTHSTYVEAQDRSTRWYVDDLANINDLARRLLSITLGRPANPERMDAGISGMVCGEVLRYKQLRFSWDPYGRALLQVTDGEQGWNLDGHWRGALDVRPLPPEYAEMLRHVESLRNPNLPGTVIRS